MAVTVKKSPARSAPMTLAEAGEALRRLPRDRRGGIALLTLLRQRSDEPAVSEGPRLAPAPIAEFSFEELSLWILEQVAGAIANHHSRGLFSLGLKANAIELDTSGKLIFPKTKARATTVEPFDPSADLVALGEIGREFLGVTGTTAEGLTGIDSFPLRAIIGTCLNPNPTERFGTVTEAVEALRTGREAHFFTPIKSQLHYVTVRRNALTLVRSAPVFTFLAFLFSAAVALPAFADRKWATLAGVGWWLWNLVLLRYWRTPLILAKRIGTEARLLPHAKIAQARRAFLRLPSVALRIGVLGWVFPLVILATAGAGVEAERRVGLGLTALSLFCFAATWAASLPRQFFYSLYLSLFVGTTQLEARLREESKGLAWQLLPQGLALASLIWLVGHPIPRSLLKKASPFAVFACLAIGALLGVSFGLNYLFRRGILTRLKI